MQVAEPSSRGAGGRLRRALLAPAALVFGGAAMAHRSMYDERWGLLSRCCLPVPVLSVGGLALGGEGKTPVAGFVAARLMACGLRVGVVSGGHGGLPRGRPERVPPRPWWEAGHDAAARLGDEALLLAGWLGRAAIVVRGRDKTAAARLAVEHGADVLVVDDGLQHHRLHRDLDVVVGAVGRPPWPVPAGDGRELGATVRPDLRWWHVRDGRFEGTDGPSRVNGATRSGADVVTTSEPRAIVDLQGRQVAGSAALRGCRVFLLAGIARPAAFADLVRSAGAEVVGERFVRDHRRLSPADLRRAASRRADVILCTEKDAARMSGALSRSWRHQGSELLALVCGMRVVAGAEQLERIPGRLATRHAAGASR